MQSSTKVMSGKNLKGFSQSFLPKKWRCTCTLCTPPSDGPDLYENKIVHFVIYCCNIQDGRCKYIVVISCIFANYRSAVLLEMQIFAVYFWYFLYENWRYWKYTLSVTHSRSIAILWYDLEVFQISIMIYWATLPISIMVYA